MPAVIGVAFVFLLGVVIWVVVSSGDADDAAPARPTAPADTLPGSASDEVPPSTPPSTTPPTPPPAPTTTTAPTTVPPTSPPTTVPPTSPPTTVPPTTSAPVTAAPGAGDDAVPGDLAVPGRVMQRPPCNGSFITVLASPIGDQATADAIAAVLDQYPGSNYLRTDQTCPSLTQSSGGQPIYVIFYGPFPFGSDACAARADGPAGAYARQLSDEIGPDHSVACAEI